MAFPSISQLIEVKARYLQQGLKSAHHGFKKEFGSSELQRIMLNSTEKRD